MPPLVTVVMPYYEGDTYIESAIRSVDAQTYSNVELIVVDDGSEIPVTDVLEGVKKNIDVSLRVLRHDENKGISATRNTGVEAACGDYVTIFDQDDVMHPEKVAVQVDQMETSSSLGMIMTNVRHVDTDGTSIGVRNLRDGIESESTDDIVRKLYQCWTTEAGPLPLTTELTRAEVYDEVGGYDTELYAANDREFLFRVATEYDVAVIDRPLLNKRYHKENASNADRKLLADRRYLTDMVTEYHPWLKQYRNRRLAFLWLLTVRTDIISQKPISAVGSYLSALEAAPSFTLRRTIEFPVKSLHSGD